MNDLLFDIPETKSPELQYREELEAAQARFVEAAKGIGVFVWESNPSEPEPWTAVYPNLPDRLRPERIQTTLHAVDFIGRYCSWLDENQLLIFAATEFEAVSKLRLPITCRWEFPSLEEWKLKQMKP